MKRVLPCLLLLAAASCSSGPDVPSYTVADCNIDDKANSTTFSITTPAAYSRDSVVQVAGAVHNSAIATGSYIIKFYDRKKGGNKPYSQVYYNENCASCGFNAKDAYGNLLRVDDNQSTSGKSDENRLFWASVQAAPGSLAE